MIRADCFDLACPSAFARIDDDRERAEETVARKMLGNHKWATILKTTVEDMHLVASKSYRRKSAVCRSSLMIRPFSAQTPARTGDGLRPDGFQSGRCEGASLAGIHLVAMRRDGTQP